MNLYKAILYVLLVYCKCSWAQHFSENQFARFSVKDGISNNYVTSIQQDTDGYIWLATDAGLNRFDGNRFSSYNYGNERVPLLSGKISKLKYFNNNELGIVTRNGFQVLNTKTLQFVNYLVPDSTMFTSYSNYVWDAEFINEHTLALTSASGFYTFSKNGKLIFRKDAYSIKDVGKKSIRYARDIFKINNTEAVVYLKEYEMGYYNGQQKVFRELPDNDSDWGIFNRPPGKTSEHWIVKNQISPDEYLFIHFETNTIYYYNHRLKKTITSPLPFSTRFEMNYESKIQALNDSTFLVNGGNTGFYILHYNKNTGKVYTNPTKQLPGIKINTIYADREKRLWLGTPEGVLMQKLKPDFFTSYNYTIQELADNETGSFTSVYAYKNKLYATRYSSNTGLCIIDKKTMTVEKNLYFFNKSRMWNEVMSVQMYHDDTLWLGTNAGIIWLDTKTGTYDSVVHLPHRPVPPGAGSAIHLSPKQNNGEGWFCYTLSGTVGKYNSANRSFLFYTSATSPALPFTKIKHIVQDADGDTWMAGHSLARLNTQKQLFDTLISIYAGEKKFNDNILLIKSDPTGSLWIHNEENGLLQYNTRLHQFTHYGREAGLPDINFEGMSPVIDSVLWLASNKAVVAFNTITRQVRSYNFPYDMIGNNPSGKDIYYDTASQKFYLLMNNSILEFSTANKFWQAAKSKLLIEEILVNNNQRYNYPANEIQLNHLQNNISIRFSLVDFEENADYTFFYKLNNETDWIPLNNQRNILLTDLPHGKYTFRIKAKMNGYETFSTITIRIAAPFWKTEWFIALAIPAGFVLLYFIFKNRIKKVREKAELDRKLIETEMKALQSQMNPHFIFNSLNSIKAMILNNNNADASRYLSKFAHLMRLTLSQSDNAFITLKSTIEYLERYIEMERIRNEDFYYSTAVDSTIDADAVYMHPMLIQPLIENAIWHGADEEHKSLHIRIQFKLEGEMLICIVDDNGIGVEKSLLQKDDSLTTHRSVGIKNIKNRIALLNEKYNLESSLTITDKSATEGKGNGTTAILKLSVKNHLYETYQNNPD